MKSSNLSCEISEPVLMNCWKHHAGFLRSIIWKYKYTPDPDLNSLRRELLRIGESIMDLYLGELTPREIADAVIKYINKKTSLSKNNFRKWLGEEGRDYRIILLEDTSKWTLRLGEKPHRYIHIHPSRYSPHTLRVRSASLKSAIVFSCLEKSGTGNRLVLVNRIRKEYLDLPPLKNIKSAASLFNLIDLLT